MRGMLTPEIEAIAKEKLGIDDLSVTALRLMPHIQYVLMNEKSISFSRINSEETEILQTWFEMGHLVGPLQTLGCTKDFWDALNEIMWMAYAGPRELEQGHE